MSTMFLGGGFASKTLPGDDSPIIDQTKNSAMMYTNQCI